MEKIIASAISPAGLDSDILQYLEQQQAPLNLESAIIYYGFPVFKDYEDLSIKSKFVILSKYHGLILLTPSYPHDLEEDDEHLSQLYSFIEAAMKKSKIIRINKKKLALNLDSYLFAADINPDVLGEFENEVLESLEGLREILNDIELETELPARVFNEARSIIEGSKALSRASKRTKLSDDPSTKLNILIALEKEVANFDIEQRKIAISLINGPQRIRGLAGSGKTVVLAMKAAHIHLQHPTKRILFTFYTKSLYGLIKETIARFYRHFAGDEPNWEYIDVLHAWGGRSIDGVCFNACIDNSIGSITFSEARSINPNDPFSVVCEHIESKHISSKYDYILVDEAQDLPNSFFKLCYKLAHGELGQNKNIVWAYDELQSIFNIYQRTPEELFGSCNDGSPRIDLNLFRANLSFGQSNDLVLFKCYRNPLEVLITAHALGMAIYSERPVQMLENVEHWNDVGYEVQGEQSYSVGKRVTIRRERKNSPLSIYEHQTVNEIIQCYRASSMIDECQWIADGVANAIGEGLKPHDILVICLDDRYAKGYFSKISLYLTQKAIRSNNLLSSSAAAPPFLLDEMVTLSTVHRAKGNEAAMVFAVGIDAIYPHRHSRSGRNKLFTAFTRTKAWLRVSGIGNKAQLFFSEINTCIDNSPNLVFEVPDVGEIETIQRDLNAKPQEILKLHELVGDLIEKGYSEDDIQMEMKFSRDKDDE